MSIRSDYKPPANWRPQRQSVRRHGLLVVTLTLIGLFGSALAYIKQNNSQPSGPAPAAAAPAPQPAKPPAPKAVVAAKPEAEPPSPAIKPKYDFYNELPKRQIDVRRDHDQAKPSAVAARAAAARPGTESPLKPGAQKKSLATPTLGSAHSKEAKSASSKDARSDNLKESKASREGKATASKEGKPAGAKKDGAAADAVATAGNNAKSATSKKAAKAEAADPATSASARVPARNTATTATAASGKSGGAPIRHLTAPADVTGPKSSRSIHNATTPTASNTVNAAKPNRSSNSAPAPRSTQSSQSVNKSSSIAVKIE
ncbi:MAG: hypothetical protein JNK31_01775 [Candidatus Competibacter sp.]|nr:hypothetical protein [Candidatus Competibacter sp.]